MSHVPRAVDVEPCAMKVIRAAGGVVCRTRSDGTIEVLLIRKVGGSWSLPKGKLKRNEGADAAVVREVQEETGIFAEVLELVARADYEVPSHRGLRTKSVDYYLMAVIGGRLRPAGGAEKIKQAEWVPFREALQRIENPRLQAIVQAAQSLFAGA
jgi:ADP-ribose pyrophosphatase YjhB (NUDIX family)